MKSKVIEVFTDGAASGNPGPGGWGGIIVYLGQQIQELGGFVEHTTNNRMELMAALECLKNLSNAKEPIFLYSDSQYLLNGMTKWLHSWKKNAWKTSENGSVANQDLWQALDDEILRRKQASLGGVTWSYVAGHSGHWGNERADEIAVSFSQNNPVELFGGDISLYNHYKNQSVPNQKNKSGPVVYLSYIDGKLERHSTWSECEARVKGRAGAKFKKVSSPQEEESVLRLWGLKN